MTDDERTAFDQIVSAEELDYLRDAVPQPRPRRRFRYYAGRSLLILLLASILVGLLWGFAAAIVWLAQHGMLAAPKFADTME